MFASASRPPHLLPSSQKPVMPSSTFASSSRAPTPTMGKTIKGLFSRAKSPEGNDQTARTRLRSVIGEKRSRPTTTTPTGGAVGQRTLTREPDEKRHRPPTPEFGAVQTKRNIRFAPSALPAMQKGEDGKWQPPSLSRGSVSTSALALYAQGEDISMEDVSRVAEKDGKGKKGGLTGLFGAGGIMGWVRDDDRTVKSQARDRPTRRGEETLRPERLRQKQVSAEANSPLQPSPPRPTPTPTKASRTGMPRSTQYSVQAIPPSQSRLIHETRQVASPPTSFDAPTEPNSGLPSTDRPTARRVRSPTAPSSSQPQLPFPPSLPTHSRSHSEPLLSKEHFAIRLSTSYLLKCLTPIIRGSSFVQNDKNIEMRRMADERLAQLERMERGWGGEWGKIAAGALEEAGQGLEGKVRSVQVGERTRERERRVWREAIRDGVLLCFLFNHLFPAQPAHIPRVNISEDGILRATNITRVITACQAINLPADDIFGLADLQDGGESGLGRVAGTILALARLSARLNPGGRSKSPVNQPVSRSASRAPSRAASPAPLLSPPGSPRKPTYSADQSRRGSNESSKPERRGSDAANDLHTKLQAALTPSAAPTPPDVTPPSSGFIQPAKVTPTRLHPLGRSTTQPNLSPLRPKSPPATPSRSGTPTNNRSSQISNRPVLRPRNTIGARPTQVSFASEPHSPTSARTSIDQSTNPPAGLHGIGGHGRERTPSLVSSGSRVTSGYTRSSAAYSINTVVGDDYSHAVDLAEEDEDGSLRRNRNWERRASEKTLHNARQKILGTLLSSEDLPEDLQVAIAAGHILPYPQPGMISPPSQDDLRGEAIMRSLDALEGVRQSAAPATGSPNRRLQMRRSHTMEPERTHAARVSEVDETSPSNSSFNSEMPRPSVIRRISANGKTYVPKRSASPATRSVPASASASAAPSLTASPTSFAFPTANPAYPQLGSAIRDLIPGSSRMERRQSDILPSTGVYSNGEMGHSDRGASMVNLSSVASSSLYRAGSSQSSAIRSGPLQILEFEEPGMPAVKYQLGNCIGRGQFGSVYRSLNIGTGQMAAIKRIRLHGMKEDEVRDVMHEVELLKRLTHPSIVKYEGMSRDEEYLNIVLEFVENGSLGQTLKAFGNFNERLVSSYVAKILEGLDYLHSQGVVHCDLKAANILSTKNGNVKLSDFGVSLNMKAVENIKQDAATRSRAGAGAGPKADVAGTPNWMAPEVISLNGAGPASDIWSLGCTIIELLTGKPPYSEITNSMTVLFRIVEDDMPPLPPVSPELEDFLKLCFIKDPSYRPSAAVLFQHPWVCSLDPQLQFLRPQDSVPFLRRVSMNSSRTDSTQLFANDGPGGCRSSGAGWSRDAQKEAMSRLAADTRLDQGEKRRSMASSSHGKEGSGDVIKVHTFIKTSFGQAIICRICHTNVKKVGVLCQTCGLISHTACAGSTTSRCDAHEQYTLYARQQEYLQSAASSRYVSPQPSFDNLDGKNPSQFPGKLLLGIKRSSKAALRSNSSVDLGADLRRRKSSNRTGSTPSPAAPLLGERSKTNPTPDAHSSQNSRQSRASMMSNVSMGSAMTEDIAEDGRHRSVIRFELGKPDVGRDVTGVRTGANESKISIAKGKKDKSDCLVQ